jgi:glycosyltransferase involved in cell wall biosynthesis
LDAAIGGGKSAILQLAAAWAASGHKVTLAGADVVEGEAAEGYFVRSLQNAGGSYDVGIYVTGSLGHFRDPAIEHIHSRMRVFWINGPGQVLLPPGPLPDVIIAPARFLARRAIDEWGFPASRIVVIAGEATTRAATQINWEERDLYSVVYASHPFKGLDNAIRLIERVRPDYPDIHLDVFGSAMLHGDHLEQQISGEYPPWVRFAGAVPQREVERLMPKYGLMLYVTSYIDGFSLATAEAMTGGVVVIATAHGSNAEFIRHGWNGLLVSSGIGNTPDLAQAEDLLRQYLTSPASYQDMRERATASVPSWQDQAKDWERVWTWAR